MIDQRTTVRKHQGQFFSSPAAYEFIWVKDKDYK